MNGRDINRYQEKNILFIVIACTSKSIHSRYMISHSLDQIFATGVKLGIHICLYVLKTEEGGGGGRYT